MDNIKDNVISKIGTVGRQTLNQKVYESLKLSILKGDLIPGTKLNEVQVAEQLNVSATPVREAFRMLSAEGLVEIIPWKGVIVQEFSKDEVKEVYQCREALEVLAVNLAIDNIDDNGIQILNQYIESSKTANNISELVEINTKIHNFIIERSGNKKLAFLMSFLNDVLLHDRNMSAFNSERKNQILLEHIEIMNALKAKDRVRAEEAIRKHIQNGYNYIEKNN